MGENTKNLYQAIDGDTVKPILITGSIEKTRIHCKCDIDYCNERKCFHNNSAFICKKSFGDYFV